MWKHFYRGLIWRVVPSDFVNRFDSLFFSTGTLCNIRKQDGCIRRLHILPISVNIVLGVVEQRNNDGHGYENVT